jgi:hypothetical protein
MLKEHTSPASFAAQWALSNFPSAGKVMPKPGELHVEFTDETDGITHRLIII